MAEGLPPVPPKEEGSPEPSSGFPYTDEYGNPQNLDDLRRELRRKRGGGDSSPDYEEFPELRPLLSLERAGAQPAFRMRDDFRADSEGSASGQGDPESSSIYSQDGDTTALPASAAAAPAAPSGTHPLPPPASREDLP